MCIGGQKFSGHAKKVFSSKSNSIFPEEDARPMIEIKIDADDDVTRHDAVVQLCHGVGNDDDIAIKTFCTT